MNKYHVNPKNGAVGVCSAFKSNCPFGGSEIHFFNKNEAKEFGELLMSTQYPQKAGSKPVGKLIVFVGLPGSGKSTFAAQEAARNPGSIIVNRDDMRTELAGEKYHNGNPNGKVEAEVTTVLKGRMIKKLREGGVVIDDNTNLNPRFLSPLIQTAKDYGAEVEVRMVDVSLAEAKRRNAKRGATGGRLVPEHVIDQMASKAYSGDGHIKDALIGKEQVFFVDKVTNGMRTLNDYNHTLEQAFPILGKDIALLDIDGTLSFNHEALDRNLGSLEPGQKKDWPAFYADYENSPVNTSVLNLVHKLRAQKITIFALTGRSDQHAGSTINFLNKAEAPISRLLMGRDGDYRGDYYVKNTALDALVTDGFSIVHSIDDRPSSIRAYEERGISVSRVPHHEVGALRASYTPSVVDDITGQGFCIKCSKELPEGEIIHSACRSK